MGYRQLLQGERHSFAPLSKQKYREVVVALEISPETASMVLTGTKALRGQWFGDARCLALSFSQGLRKSFHPSFGA